MKITGSQSSPQSSGPRPLHPDRDNVPGAAGPRPQRPQATGAETAARPAQDVHEVDEAVTLGEVFREAELHMLAIRQGIRADLESIAAKLDEIFGDQRRSDEVKALGKEFKEAAQAALTLARESMAQTGDFDGAALTASVQEAFDALRAGLEETLGVSFGGPGTEDAAPEVVDATPLDQPLDGRPEKPDTTPATDTRPDTTTVPAAPTPTDVPDVISFPSAEPGAQAGQVGQDPARPGATVGPETPRPDVQPDPTRSRAELRDEVNALFGQLTTVLEGLGRALGADRESGLAQLPEFDDVTRSYLESILQSIEERGRRFDAAG